MVSVVSADLLIHKFNVLSLGLLTLCSSIIFTIEYNFTPTQIVCIILINYKITSAYLSFVLTGID